MSQLLNFLFYQLGWFACVLGLSWDRQWIGIGIASCLVAAHLWLASDRALQAKLILIAAAFGMIVDSLQLQFGVFTFPQGSTLGWLPPLAITLLWMQFATTFRYCMRWLSGRYRLCALFGLIGGPLAFFAGEKLGAIEFLSPRILHFGILGLVWACAVPLLVYITDHFASSVSGIAEYRWPVVPPKTGKSRRLPTQALVEGQKVQ